MNTLETFLHWLVAASLRATLLALAVLVLQFALRRWLPARWRHALWLPVIFVLVAPQLPASRWSVQNHFATPPAIVRTTLSPTNDSATNVAASLEADQPAEPPAPAPAAPHLRSVIWLVWFLGASALIGSGLVGYARSLRRIRREALPTNPALAATVADVARQLRLRRAPEIIVSNAVTSPAVAGLWRPMLLLPAGFPTGFSAAEARLILLHELTHLRRGDLLLNWLLCLLQALHWFNPLLWFAFSRMRADREMACDAQVLAIETEDRRGDYGHALLKLQSAAPHPSLSLAFVGIFERRAGLRARICAVAGYRRAHRAWGMAAVASVILLTIVGATRAQVTEPAAIPMLPIIAPLAANFEIAPELTKTAKTEPIKAPAEDAVPAPAAEAEPAIPQIEIIVHFAEVNGVMWKAISSAGDWTRVRSKQEWLRLIASTRPAEQKALVGKWFDAAPTDSLAAPATPPRGGVNQANAIMNLPEVQARTKGTDGDFMSLLLKGLNQRKGVDLLAAPRVITRSQQRATIEVIREFRYATAWEPGKKKTDPWTPTNFATKNLGVTLTATPTVTDDGRIDLWFEPLVSEFEGFTDLGQGRQKPTFFDRRAQTTVSLRSGQTVILGGAVRIDTQKVEDRVPILGVIPLFRSSTTQKIERYLVVFVTPRIVERKLPAATGTELRPVEASQPVNTRVMPPIKN